MIKFSKELEAILKTELFNKIISSDFVVITEVNAFLTLLIEARIPFDLEYSPGTRREAAALNLVIYINPTTTISFVITLQAGGSVFSES